MINTALMTAALVKSAKQTDVALDALKERDQSIDNLETTMRALEGLAGACNDRFAVAKAERDAFRSLTLEIVKELKGLAPASLSLPGADRERQSHLQQAYEEAKVKHEAEIMRTYATFSPALRDGLLGNPVRQAGKGKLIKDFD